MRSLLLFVLASVTACRGESSERMNIAPDPARNVPPTIPAITPLSSFSSRVAENALGAVDSPACGAVTVRVFVEFQRDGFVRRVWPVEPPRAPVGAVAECITRKLSRARMPPIASQMDAPPIVSWLTR